MLALTLVVGLAVRFGILSWDGQNGRIKGTSASKQLDVALTMAAGENQCIVAGTALQNPQARRIRRKHQADVSFALPKPQLHRPDLIYRAAVLGVSPCLSKTL
jgi:hypothetical protein